MSFAAPKEPVIILTPICEKSTPNCLIRIEASVLDIEDIHSFNGGLGRHGEVAIGKFFSSTLMNSEDGDTAHERRVVGWHPQYAQANTTRYSPEHMVMISTGEAYTPEEAACTYAAISVACCIVDGEARARPGETLSSNLERPLEFGLQQVCVEFDVSMSASPRKEEVEFFVTYNESSRILVNENTIDLRKYLQ